MKLNIWKEFVRVWKAAKKEFIIKVLVSVLLRGLLLVFPLTFSEAINQATKGEYNSAYLFVGISIAIIVIYRLSEGINQSAFYKLYNKLFSFYYSMGVSKTNDNSMFSLSRFNIGQYTNILSTDVDIMAGFFGNLVIRVIQLLEFIIIYAYFLSLDKFLFISAVLVSIIVLILIPISNKKVEIINGNKKTEYDKMIMSTHEFFKNIKEIKCFNLFDKVKSRPEGQANKYLKENANYFVTYTWNNQLFLLVFEVFRLLSVGYGVYLITQGNMEIGALLIIYNYYQKIIDNYATILAIVVDYTNLKVSYERFNHLIEYSSPRKIKNDSAEQITEGKIIFNDILYGYKNNPTLNNVSFEAGPNSLTVITGKAGNGKTGIFDLLLKLNRQHQGTITIDDVDINTIDDNEYFSKISLLNKKPTLFAMSIMDNLKLVESDENKILELCIKLGIHDEVLSLKDGYDTIMNDNDGISESLKQLVAIARTMLRGSKIMLLDDALIGLEESKQDKILTVLKDYSESRTILMITTDKNIMKDADKIIVLDNRKVVEIGTLNELINSQGYYYKLFGSHI